MHLSILSLSSFSFCLTVHGCLQIIVPPSHPTSEGNKSSLLMLRALPFLFYRCKRMLLFLLSLLLFLRLLLRLLLLILLLCLSSETCFSQVVGATS